MKKRLTLLLCVASFMGAIAQNSNAVKESIKQHNEAVYIKEGWIRDPYITLGPDDRYYLTGTVPNAGDPRELSDPYNVGLGKGTIVGQTLRIWVSDDLVEWSELDSPYSLDDTFQRNEGAARGLKPAKQNGGVLWAPELHWSGEHWLLVHCPQHTSNLAISANDKMEAPWSHPSPLDFEGKHDPSLFLDDDGSWYLLWGNTTIAKINPNFEGLATEPVRIDPADRKIGHEGATLRKIGDKYVHIGTAWSTDKGRKGSYNMYYCTADNITGPYSERRFLGRFLGHGTPFQDKAGNWWCTAFFNGNVPPIDDKDIENRDLSETAQSINKVGTTIVPLEVRILDDGDVYIRAKDPRYGTPGPDEVQKFEF